MSYEVYPGSPHPLGAEFDGVGVNFSLFSERAEKVVLCLFDSPESKKPDHELELFEQTHGTFHGYLPDVRPGQLYGYRVYGPYRPENGLRFNHHKILLDPYARAIGRELQWDQSHFGYHLDSGDPQSFDKHENSATCQLGVVVDRGYDWSGDIPPQNLRGKWWNSLIYEAHVKGLTMLHPEVPEHLRGTYDGVVCKPVLDHLKRLKVTAIEFMPIAHGITGRHLHVKGLSNYWNYDPILFFAPSTRYVSSVGSGPKGVRAIQSFRRMVKILHQEGIEVILDVVFNHTGEGNQMGPTICYRGIDNSSYYILEPGDARYYRDYSGCGNTLNVSHPQVLQLVMDSLRYWVTEMHVDGFRFDLASALGREPYSFETNSAFFKCVKQDPILAPLKFIAEPWDCNGEFSGRFPVRWSEWNGNYWRSVRRYWRGDPGNASDLATRLSGSSDLFQHSGRRPFASVNYIACHDGFPLHDAVSYSGRRNHANGEDNRDGPADNYTWNCGAEGEVDDLGVLELRERQKRNMMATLFLSAGVPMLLAGDELSRSQLGNNNAYCHDAEWNYLRWDLGDREKGFLKFVEQLAALRADEPTLQRRRFFHELTKKDRLWFHPDGHELHSQHWGHNLRCFATCLIGDAIIEKGVKGERIVGSTLLIILNAAPEGASFVLPTVGDFEHCWQIVMDTDKVDSFAVVGGYLPGERYPVQPRSVVLLKRAP